MNVTSQLSGVKAQRKCTIKEEWRVAGKTYESSAELLNSGDRFEMNQAHYTRAELRPKTLGERVSDVAKNTILCGALATGINAALAVATGGASIGIVSAAILVGGLLTGAAAGIGGHPEKSADGVINSCGEKTFFYPDNKAERQVEVKPVDNATALLTVLT